MLVEQMRKDFQNVFLKEAGQEITVERSGEDARTLQGLVQSSKEFQFEHDADVQVGDVLRADASAEEMTVKRIKYETAEGQRVILIALG